MEVVVEQVEVVLIVIEIVEYVQVSMQVVDILVAELFNGYCDRRRNLRMWHNC